MERQVAFRALTVLLAIVLVLATLGLGCAPVPAPKKGAVEIAYWYTQGEPFLTVVREIVAKFNQEQSEVVVNLQYVPYEEYMQKAVTATAGGNPPDLVHIAYWDAGFLAEQGVLVNLDERFIANDKAFQADVPDFYPFLWETSKYKGKVYAVPYHTNVKGWFYNKDLWDKAGLKPFDKPYTWDDLIIASQKLTRDVDGDGKIDQWAFEWAVSLQEFATMVLQDGGRVFNEDNTKVVFNSPQGVAVLQFWMDMIYKYKAAPGAPAGSGRRDWPACNITTSFTWWTTPGRQLQGWLPSLPKEPIITTLAGMSTASSRATGAGRAAGKYVKWALSKALPHVHDQPPSLLCDALSEHA